MPLSRLRNRAGSFKSFFQKWHDLMQSFRGQPQWCNFLHGLHCPVVKIFCSQYVTRTSCLYTATSCEAFQRSTDAVTGALPVASGKKVPFTLYMKISTMMTQIVQVFPIFVLQSSPIAKI